MHRLKAFSPARPHRSHAVGVLSAQEAASRLSRLEFDVARLSREIETSEARAACARRALIRIIDERHTLIEVVAQQPAVFKERTKDGA